MTAPVVKAFALAHPDMQVTMVSRPFAKAFYDDLAPNIRFVGIDLKAPRYKGALALEHLYQDIRALKPDMIADLHDVLRTQYLRLRFHLANTFSTRHIPIAHIDKHRAGRKAITRQENKQLSQQPTSFEKYQAVLAQLVPTEWPAPTSVPTLNIPTTDALPSIEGTAEATDALPPLKGRAGVTAIAYELECEPLAVGRPLIVEATADA